MILGILLVLATNGVCAALLDGKRVHIFKFLLKNDCF